MGGHHLILGELRDYLTGETLEDTHDEQYRQKLARILVEKKGYRKAEILPRHLLEVQAGKNRGRLPVDLQVILSGRTGMVIKYGPGSLVTRYRPALAVSRLVTPYQVPVVVVTNGENADVLDGVTGKVTASGLNAIPSRTELADRMADFDFPPVPEKRAEMESRIVFAYEIDGSCPCDTTVCRLNEE